MEKISLPVKKGSFLLVFIFGFTLLFFSVFLIVWKVMHHTHGVFMYPLDDSFIHLTIADNLLKGTWGINQDQFASASSSVLYTLILAFFRLFSSSPMIPFLVNCLAGIAILALVQIWLNKHLISYKLQAVIFFLVIFFTPLPLLVISGMEHTLQCLFSFMFVFYFSDWLEQSNKSEKQALPFKIFLFAVLVTSIRYEGIFLIAIACLLLLFYKKLFSAFALGFVSLVPLLVFGLTSISKGQFFFPNSVIVKSGTFSYSGPVSVIKDILFERLTFARNGIAALATQRLMIAIPLLYLVFRKYLRPSYFFILVFLFGAATLQLSFAATGWLYRYEAYLFFCTAIILPVIFYNYGRRVLAKLDSLLSKMVVISLILLLFFPVLLRSMTALEKTSQACINIYDQQYQMAMFTKTYYNEDAVALNDIGAVGYFTNSKIVDLWGLANVEVTKSKKQHNWTPVFLDSLCRKDSVRMAIIYDSWFSDSLTGKWSKAATWQIQDNVICGDSIVSFYALDPSAKPLLEQRLKSYQSQLPGTVKVRYY